MKTEPRALFSGSGHRAMKVQAWVLKWAEVQGLTLKVQVEQTLRQDVYAQEGVTKNTMTIRVVCGNGLEYLNLKDIHASFIQRNGLKGTCVYGREDVNFNKKKGNDRPRVFTAIVDKQVLSRLLTIQKKGTRHTQIQSSTQQHCIRCKGCGLLLQGRHRQGGHTLYGQQSQTRHAKRRLRKTYVQYDVNCKLLKYNNVTVHKYKTTYYKVWKDKVAHSQYIFL
jgi:hypothetical protein